MHSYVFYAEQAKGIQPYPTSSDIQTELQKEIVFSCKFNDDSISI